MFTRLFNRSTERTSLGGKPVVIPKLTPAKWKALLSKIETIPHIIMSVLAAHDSKDFTATVVVGAGLALDEAVEIVAILAEMEPDFVANHADLSEISEFIRLTVEKNDLRNVVKNFRAVLGHLQPTNPPTDGVVSEM